MRQNWTFILSLFFMLLMSNCTRSSELPNALNTSSEPSKINIEENNEIHPIAVDPSESEYVESDSDLKTNSIDLYFA